MNYVEFDSSRPMDLVLLGRVAIDFNPAYNDQVKEEFKPLKKVHMFEKFVGGSPANIAVGVTRHGMKAGSGAKVIQLHTGGMCHLDAAMTRQGLEGLETGDVELAILENVGNLVCPAEFDTGACKNAMILSVPEGDDKPLKYPLMFSVCDVVLINKIDVLPYFDFDMDKCVENIHMRNPGAKVIPICAKTGEGIDIWAKWLLEQREIWMNQI